MLLMFLIKMKMNFMNKTSEVYFPLLPLQLIKRKTYIRRYRLKMIVRNYHFAFISHP